MTNKPPQIDAIMASVRAFGYCPAPHDLTMSSLSAAFVHLSYVMGTLGYSAHKTWRLIHDLRIEVLALGKKDLSDDWK